MSSKWPFTKSPTCLSSVNLCPPSHFLRLGKCLQPIQSISFSMSFAVNLLQKKSVQNEFLNWPLLKQCLRCLLRCTVTQTHVRNNLLTWNISNQPTKVEIIQQDQNNKHSGAISVSGPKLFTLPVYSNVVFASLL